MIQTRRENQKEGGGAGERATRIKKLERQEPAGKKIKRKNSRDKGTARAHSPYTKEVKGKAERWNGKGDDSSDRAGQGKCHGVRKICIGLEKRVRTGR